MVNIIAETMRTDVEIETEEERLRPENSEVERLWADNKKIKKLTGWMPEYGGVEGLRRGIGETVAWFINPENLKRYKADIYNL
jgi:dTDP-glucose 4,6-dehydratase/UDP-glucose 4-epimerase